MAAAPKIADIQKAVDEKGPLPFPVRSSAGPATILLHGKDSPWRFLTGVASTPLGQVEPSVHIEDDYHGWLLDQAAALRHRNVFSLDWEHLAEELDDMAALRRDALRSDLIVVLVHMLKLGYETGARQREEQERLWKLHLIEHRDRVNNSLRQSGTLRAEFEQVKKDAYKQARKQAGVIINPNQAPLGPDECPWSTDQILDEDFFPSSIAK